MADLRSSGTSRIGDAHRITNGLNGYDHVSVTADSSALVAVQADQQSRLWVGLASGVNGGREITSGTARLDAEPAWTPDGKIVYYA